MSVATQSSLMPVSSNALCSRWASRLRSAICVPSTVTDVPSRLRTISRALQLPEMAIQCGNRSREYPVIEPSLRTVRALSSDWAVVLLGMLGGVAEAVCAKAADSAVAARTATQRRRDKTRTSDTGPPEGRRRGGLPAGSCRAACAIL
jgi:hypothetical protein